MDREKPHGDGNIWQGHSFSGGFSGQVTAGSGRTEVNLAAEGQGADCVLRITGGRAHVGAVATAEADNVQLSVIGIHKEGPLAKLCAGRWASMAGNVCVALVGIHQDEATAEEIASIVTNVETGLEELMQQWRRWQARIHAQNLEALMIKWCMEAGNIARHYHRNTGDLEFKSPNEAVTEADGLIENLLRKRIGEAFPDDLIVGEEFGGPATDTVEPGQRVWQIDPIDGTLNFALGLPDYCISLAVLSGTKILAACVHQPTTGDTFSALAGNGARLNGDLLQVSSRRKLKDSILCLHLKEEGRVMADPPLVRTLLAAPMKLRRCGAVALELAWVAAGFYDLLLASFKGKLHLWDIAAGLLLIQEAGGVAVNFENQPYELESSEMMVGSPLVASELVTLLGDSLP